MSDVASALWDVAVPIWVAMAIALAIGFVLGRRF